MAKSDYILSPGHFVYYRYTIVQWIEQHKFQSFSFSVNQSLCSLDSELCCDWLKDKHYIGISGVVPSYDCTTGRKQMS